MTLRPSSRYLQSEQGQLVPTESRRKASAVGLNNWPDAGLTMGAGDSAGVQYPTTPEKSGVSLILARDIFAHELRTPLTVASMSLQLLKDSAGLSASARWHVDRLEQCLAWFSHAIENMSAWAALIGGAITLERRRVLVREWVGPAVELVRPLAQARERQVQLSCQAPKAGVFGDPWWLRQAMVSLLANAVRSGPRGRAVDVVVGVQRGRLTVRVISRGPDSARLNRVSGSDGDDAADYSGDPGLYLARAVVRLHGGTLTAAAGRGRPATFTVTLPVAG